MADAKKLRTMSEEYFSPERAKEILDYHNHYNRKINKSTVKLFATYMEEGKWDENVPNVISFYEDGNVCDGQHRLAAVVKSTTVQKFYVAKDIPVESIINFDVGRKRSAESSTALVIREEVPSNVYAVVRGANHLKNRRKHLEESNFSQQYGECDQMEDYLNMKEEFDEALSFGKEIHSGTGKALKPSEVGAIYFYLIYVMEIPKNIVVKYFNTFVNSRLSDNVFSRTAISLKEKDPINRTLVVRGSARTNAYISCWASFIKNNLNRRVNTVEWFKIPTKKQLSVLESEE